MGKIMFILMLFAMGAVSCSVNNELTKEMTSYPSSAIRDKTSCIITKALPDWNFLVYDNKGKNYSLILAKRFIFFNDSIFACDGFANDSVSNSLLENRYTTKGQYKKLNDSIIEVVYNDGNNPTAIHVKHICDKPQNFTVNIKSLKPELYINEMARYIKWSWLKNDTIIMDEKWAFPPDSKDNIKWLVTLFTDIEFSEQINSKQPDKIVFTWEIPRFRPGPMIAGMFSTMIDIIKFGYEINIKDLRGNYVAITDDRDSSATEAPINYISLEYDVRNYRCYPNKLRFKKKDGKLILLNHDGSESTLSLEILSQ